MEFFQNGHRYGWKSYNVLNFDLLNDFKIELNKAVTKIYCGRSKIEYLKIFWDYVCKMYWFIAVHA